MSRGEFIAWLLSFAAFFFILLIVFKYVR